MDIKNDLMKNKFQANVSSIIMEEVKVKCSNKACPHNKVIVALNTSREKYLNYETSFNDDLIGNVCVRCHDTKELNSF